jgi:hypothetical protein
MLNIGGQMKTEEISAEIESEISRLKQVRALLTGTGPKGNRKSGRPAASLSGGPAKRRTLSVEARERIAAAQRVRWAKFKRVAKRAAPVGAVSVSKKTTPGSMPAKKGKKRTLSAGARAKIAAAQKARWAKVRKGAKKSAVAKASKKSATTKRVASRKRAVPQRAQTSVAVAVPAASGTRDS